MKANTYSGVIRITGQEILRSSPIATDLKSSVFIAVEMKIALLFFRSFHYRTLFILAPVENYDWLLAEFVGK